MKVAISMTDNRVFHPGWGDPTPHFGTPQEALLQGFAELPEVDVHVICCARKRMQSPEKLAGNIWFHSLVVPKIGWMRTFYQGCIRATRKKFREIQPDIVHGQGTELDAGMVAVFSGLPNLLTIHGNMCAVARINRAKPFSFEWMAARLEAFALPRTGGVICITSYTQRAVSPVAKSTWVLPNPVDRSFFAIERRTVLPKEIACVGFISGLKNQVRLIEALQPLAAMEKFQLVFHGDSNPGDPYSQQFIRLVEKMKWCRFAGYTRRPELRAALARATMLVLPSLEENCPMVVLEAMAAGVPVAAARVGGVPDLIRDNVDGVLFDPNDAEDICRAVTAILSNEGFAAKLAAAAREKALACFNPTEIAAGHLEIYREILQKRNRP